MIKCFDIFKSDIRRMTEFETKLMMILWARRRLFYYWCWVDFMTTMLSCVSNVPHYDKDDERTRRVLLHRRVQLERKTMGVLGVPYYIVELSLERKTLRVPSMPYHNVVSHVSWSQAMSCFAINIFLEKVLYKDFFISVAYLLQWTGFVLKVVTHGAY